MREDSLLNVLPLGSQHESLFWNYVYQDIPLYYFFILDMKHDRASTKILLALKGQNCIEGMMMIYEERIVQLRGSSEAAKALLAKFDGKKAEILGLEEHKDLILGRFKKMKMTLDLVLMTLKKGEETLHLRYPVVNLSSTYAAGIAALMRHGDPEWWEDVTTEKITSRMRGRLWLGIKVNGQLASIGGATTDDWGSNISTVVTHESHRNKGYATSIVSALVDRILEKSKLVLIHVESDNAPAVRAYRKVGFKPYTRYFVARAK